MVVRPSSLYEPHRSGESWNPYPNPVNHRQILRRFQPVDGDLGNRWRIGPFVVATFVSSRSTKSSCTSSSSRWLFSGGRGVTVEVWKNQAIPGRNTRSKEAATGRSPRIGWGLGIGGAGGFIPGNQHDQGHVKKKQEGASHFCQQQWDVPTDKQSVRRLIPAGATVQEQQDVSNTKVNARKRHVELSRSQSLNTT